MPLSPLRPSSPLLLGTDSWRRAVRNSVRQDFDFSHASPPPQPPPPTPHTTPCASPTPTHLESTLTEVPASVDSKPLTQTLSPLDATLTRATTYLPHPLGKEHNPGEKPLIHARRHTMSRERSSFHWIAGCFVTIDALCRIWQMFSEGARLIDWAILIVAFLVLAGIFLVDPPHAFT